MGAIMDSNLSIYIPILFPIFLIGLAQALFILGRSKKRKTFLNSSFEIIDEMDGFVFEEYCDAVFWKLGYKVKITPQSGDHGADLVLWKDGVRSVVQCKRWNYYVRETAVLEVLNSKGYYQAENAIVITNSTFTKAARELADVNDVKLIDRKWLSDFMIHFDLSYSYYK